MLSRDRRQGCSAVSVRVLSQSPTRPRRSLVAFLPWKLIIQFLKWLRCFVHFWVREIRAFHGYSSFELACNDWQSLNKIHRLSFLRDKQYWVWVHIFDSNALPVCQSDVAFLLCSRPCYPKNEGKTWQGGFQAASICEPWEISTLTSLVKEWLSAERAKRRPRISFRGQCPQGSFSQDLEKRCWL